MGHADIMGLITDGYYYWFAGAFIGSRRRKYDQLLAETKRYASSGDFLQS
jgi:hypothetical protein